jgi:hypothetical protein
MVTFYFNPSACISGHNHHLQCFIFLTVGLYLHLAVSVVHEIKDALGIYCFRSENLCVTLLFRKLSC